VFFSYGFVQTVQILVIKTT